MVWKCSFLRRMEMREAVNNSPVAVEGYVVAKSPKAMMIGKKPEGFGEWIPYSQILDSDFGDPEEADVGDFVTLAIPLWLALEKGLT